MVCSAPPLHAATTFPWRFDDHESSHKKGSERCSKLHCVRAVIGVPLYNAVTRGHLDEALTSLLAQAYRQVGLVLVDDGSTDGTIEQATALIATHPNVYLVSNPHRVGLIQNWRRTFTLAHNYFPEAEYFAWGSDHDRWHPQWLEKLICALDRHPHAVMAYPQSVRINDGGHEITHPWPPSFRRRIKGGEKIGAGNLIYGLYRIDALAFQCVERVLRARAFKGAFQSLIDDSYEA